MIVCYVAIPWKLSSAVGKCVGAVPILYGSTSYPEQVRQHTNPREPLTTRRDHTGTPDNKNNTNTTRLISNSSYPSNRGFRSNSTTTTTTTTSGSVGRDNNNQRYPKQPTDSVAGTRVAAKSVVNGTRVGSSGASAGAGGGAGPEDTQKVSYSQRVARLRKPALTAADKLGLEPEERARIFRELRTPRSRVVVPRRAGGSSGDGGRGGTGDQAIRAASSRTHLRGPDPAAAGRSAGSETQPGPGTKPGKPDVALLPLPLRVFCYGIDDVRLYRALEEADALGLVVVVSQVAAADAVFATRVKRTGKALTLDEVGPGRHRESPVVSTDAVLAFRRPRTESCSGISNAARNANKPFVELSAVSAMRVMEAVEELTGWLVPEHLRRRTPPPPLALLPPLDAADSTGSAEALGLLTGGLTLSEYILARAGQDLPVSLIRELDRTDLYDSRDELLPVNPQEREAARQRPVFRPYMHGSRMARQRLLREHMRSRAEAEGVVPW
ncbi:hypothetical protein VOLCADRAFT_103113 [Volvox carteri f. nagariensis]|uniref:Uncharacterized protein n=1 Tax=Volvox carteri f. nagariensis TaxID=3068 RepID=D8TKP9_VOLCA|nr:uncharacterized protein VOLCADRAFT_103113 [Volvox carteri f. nagariensis]EFJ52103.1 hypothetical protein VOLCADRAFT_103113 [Volvox carteri f. nagariensis]|eukprot:XP_002946877.1 hypothetical protein VOLCADRAFT_103113 [Volvox carteri f. nagariensis]